MLTDGSYPGSTPLGSLNLHNEVHITILRKPDTSGGSDGSGFGVQRRKMTGALDLAKLRAHPRRVLSSSRKYLDIIFTVCRGDGNGGVVLLHLADCPDLCRVVLAPPLHFG